MRPLRIVIYGWASSTHIIRWSKGLSGKNCEVKVVSLGGEPIDGIETVIFTRKIRSSYISYAKQAVNEAIKFNPDIIHLHYAGGFSFWGIKTKDIPMIVSVWGSDIILPNNFIKNLYIKKALKKANAITATSNYLKSKVIDYYPKISGKTEVIPFGVNILHAPSDFPQFNSIKICFTKALRSIYGPDTLLYAIAIVRNHITNLEVNLAGEGEMRKELEKIIKDENLANIVNLVGFIENSNIYEFIKKHHLLVMPSRQESFGVSVLEASAVGRPIIATDVGGISEVVINSKTGILVKPNDAEELAESIIKLCSEPSLMIQMGQAGHKFVRDNYDWDNSLDMMVELYRKVLYEKE